MSESSDSSEESESVIEFNKPADAENKESADDEESEDDDEDQQDIAGDGGHNRQAARPSAPIPDSVLTLIVNLLQRYAGYYCRVEYDPQHDIIHIGVPSSVVPTWQVRRNMIQHLYARVPLLRQLLDQGTLEISFTRGVKSLLDRYNDEAPQRSYVVQLSDEEPPALPRSVKEARGVGTVAPEVTEQSRDSVESPDQGTKKSRARAEMDSFLADLQSREETEEEHVPVRVYNGPQPNYRDNMTRVNEMIAQYRELWFSEEKPRDDYDTWFELQSNNLVENIKGHLARVQVVSVKHRLTR